ncbi:MAG: lipopolysaccharide heptosyltransferase family protein [Gammaproteobacteria bacterium]|nr:MAG: lipopolysaccharide heptosyltransferase family protein [Gammaproteobacteria bacterium]
MNNKIKKILIVRPDKIGDLVLILPAILSLQKNLPTLQISLLVSSYAKDLTDFMENIDKIIIDNQDIKKLTTEIKKYQFDAVISLFSTFHIARVLKKTKIPIRIAPATKIWQFYYNHRIPQRRSLSLKPEYEYNTDLISYFVTAFFKTDLQQKSPPYLKLEQKTKQQVLSQFYQNYPELENKKIIFVHPGSGGSAQNLNLEQYAKIIISLIKKGYVPIISPGVSVTEQENALILQNIIKNKKIKIYQPEKKHSSLKDFIKLLSIVDVFIAGSTGPLHISAAFNKKTIAFYPNRQSATAIRWQTINAKNNRLYFSPPQSCDDMTKIDIDKIIPQIISFIKQ